MINKSGKSSNGLMIFLIVLVVVVIVGLGAVLIVPQLTGTPIVKTPTGSGDTTKFSGFYFEIDADPMDSQAQDASSDMEYDVFEWNPAKNADLKAKGILDCGSATPITFDGDTPTAEIEEANKCVINVYKFWRDSNYNEGDEELKIDDYVNQYSVDRTSTNSTKIKAGETYLVVVTESASTDTWDLEPLAFLITSGTETTYDRDSLEAGTIVFTVQYKYYSSAIMESKTRIEGECDDSEGTDPALGSALDEVITSAIDAQPTNYDTECTVDVVITKNGYKLFLENPLADGESEMSYSAVYPYVNLYNGTGGGILVKVVDPAVTGSGVVKYTGGSNVTSAGNYTLWESLVFCGKTITDSSTSNADVNIGERIYQKDIPSCLKDAKDQGGKTSFTIKFTNMQAVNFSESTCDTTTANQEDCADEVIGNGDLLVNFTISALAGTTDPITAILTG